MEFQHEREMLIKIKPTTLNQTFGWLFSWFIWIFPSYFQERSEHPGTASNDVLGMVALVDFFSEVPLKCITNFDICLGISMVNSQDIWRDWFEMAFLLQIISKYCNCVEYIPRIVRLFSCTAVMRELNVWWLTEASARWLTAQGLNWCILWFIDC